ncbi:MAG: GNAT family N-acetyltransferase [Candidatus Rokubacteria bacterium]|nr:GNAT family N-acetyltransferase [Candidatus Rokubacteria bacterium]
MTAPPCFRLEILRGRDGLAAGLTPERLVQWQALADEEKKVAVFQAPAFVRCWYEVYEPEYEPLLLLGHAPGGRLVGVMPLALPRPRRPGALVVAGAHQAEYAGWLAAPPFQDEFPARCVARLAELGLFAGTWRWRWLAPGSGLGWLEHPALRVRGIEAIVEEAQNPVLSLHEGTRFFDPRGKNHKRKMAKLRALGPVRLERLEAASLGEALFERFTTLCDVRQLARHGEAPFADDPRKAAFHRALVSRAPVFLHALMAGEEAIAFHFCIADRARAIYCMSQFDCRYLAASPGKLIADLAAEALARAGIEEIDLTPAGEYKEEVATRHESVHTLRLFSSRGRARRARVRAAARRRLKALGLRVGLDRRHLDRARDLVTRARAQTPWGLAAALIRAARGWLWSRDVALLYVLDRDAAAAPLPGEDERSLRRDELGDLVHYAGSNRWLPRPRLMRSAIDRIGGGEHCYTALDRTAAGEPVLTHYAWLELDAAVVRLEEVGGELPLPARTAVLYDAYTEPAFRGRGLHVVSLARRVRDAFGAGMERVVIASLESNRASRRGIEALGFRPVRRLVRHHRLGRTWRADENLSGPSGLPADPLVAPAGAASPGGARRDLSRSGSRP